MASPAISTTLRSTRTVRRRANAPAQRTRTKAYHPYHPHGELVFLLVTAVIGVVWLALPLNFWVVFAGAIGLYVIVPPLVMKEYWPKLQLHHLGWQMPHHPKHPVAYSSIIIGLSFLPLALFLLAPDPARYAAVDPAAPWIAWWIGQGLVAILLMTQSAFLTGLVLFRLTHLVRPVTAILMIGAIMTLGQLLLPGSIGVFALPLSVAFAWIAWQTHSFVPVAAAQLLISITYDLIVRLSL